MTSNQLKLGFVGLGIMGAPMAGHLLKSGHSTGAAQGWDPLGHSALVKALEWMAAHEAAGA